MLSYLHSRSEAFNRDSEFSCPDGCERHGCNEPGLHISLTLVDLVAMSLASGEGVSDLVRGKCNLVFDPLDERDPWVGRIGFELKKPCSFLHGKACSIYAGRPMACALFPETFFALGREETAFRSEIFGKYPCTRERLLISPKRKELLFQLFRLSAEEAFLSDFYLFGVSPFLLDLKDAAGEGLEEVDGLEGKKAKVRYDRIGAFMGERFRASGVWAEWEAKLRTLDQIEGKEAFLKVKLFTDPMANLIDRSRLNVVHQFDGVRLRPIRRETSGP